MKQARRISGIYRSVVNALAVLGAAIILFMMLSISVGVITRFFLHRSLVWLIEISGYGMVFMTFLVAAWILREEGHVRVDLLLDRLNRTQSAVLETVMSFVGAMVCLVITIYGIIVTWDHLQRGVRTATDLEVPWALLLAVIPLGTLALTIQFVARAWGHLKSMKSAPTP